MERSEDVRQMLSAVSGLSWRDQRVIRLRYLKGMSLAEVGERINISKERVRQIQNRALVHLREAMEVEA